MIENLTAELIALMNLMLTTYHTASGADEYWFGFVVDHRLYVVPRLALADLAPFFRMERAAMSKGGRWKVRIRARVDELRALIPAAILLGSEDLLKRLKNKGDSLEWILSEMFGDGKWKHHDSTEFSVAGDLVIRGKQVQVKFNGATLTDEKVLINHAGALG